MTSHALAKKLLDGPDLPVTSPWTGSSRFEIEAIDEEVVAMVTGGQYWELSGVSSHPKSDLVKVLVVR